MIKQKSGVILSFGGSGPQTLSGLGGFEVALDALEGLRRQWALELGQYGIRVVTLKTVGFPRAFPLMNRFVPQSKRVSRKKTLTQARRHACGCRQRSAFARSDQARTITSTEVNISAGAMVD